MTDEVSLPCSFRRAVILVALILFFCFVNACQGESSQTPNIAESVSRPPLPTISPEETVSSSTQDELDYYPGAQPWFLDDPMSSKLGVNNQSAVSSFAPPWREDLQSVARDRTPYFSTGGQDSGFTCTDKESLFDYLDGQLILTETGIRYEPPTHGSLLSYLTGMPLLLTATYPSESTLSAGKDKQSGDMSQLQLTGSIAGWGQDPLDAQWSALFQKIYKRSPEGQDRFLRLFSLAYPDEWDWNLFYDSNGYAKSDAIEKIMKDPPNSRSWKTLPDALLRLSRCYGKEESEKFVRDIGTLFAGLPDRFSASGNEAVTGCSIGLKCEDELTIPAHIWAYLQPAGMPVSLTKNSGDANVHHWAWSVVLGYHWGTWASTINALREIQQVTDFGQETPPGEIWVDIWVGSSGGALGRALSLL